MGEILVQGVTMAAIYAIVAVSFNIIYRPTNIFNFAQGDLLMVGAVLTAVLTRSYGIPWYAAAGLAIAAVALLSVTIDLVAVSPVIKRSSHGAGILRQYTVHWGECGVYSIFRRQARRCSCQ